MRHSRWKARAAPIILDCLRAHPGPAERRRALRRAYPFGERRHWPYRAWLAEIHAQWPAFRKPRREPEELELTP